MLIAPPAATTALQLDQLPLKRWSVEDYHRMAELGLLSTDRTELLAGYITVMAAKGTPHVTSLRLLTRLLDTLLANELAADQWFISTQDPIQLDEFSLPEPDLAIVRGTVLEYADHHPQPADICLIVEVADKTLKHDCELKQLLYAQAGLVEYWVLDVQNRQLHIFQQPTPTGYTHHLILTEPNQASPLAFPNLTIDLTAILPPK